MQNRDEVEIGLKTFAEKNSVFSKGSLSAVLILTRRASKMPMPLSTANFLTGKKGQVAGLSGPAIKKILNDHGIDRALAEEGGRTSRGNLALMNEYIGYLNKLDGKRLLDFAMIEKWWVERVKLFFAAQPISVRADVSDSLRTIISGLLESALARQRECTGTMVVGAVLEHLVGAKIAIALPKVTMTHKSFSSSDESLRAKGDFLVGDTAIHVTVAPTEALVRKCRRNLSEGLRPLVVTTEDGVGGMMALAKNDGIASRIDILEVSQFLTTNVYEWIGFQSQKRSMSLENLVNAYNKIIDDYETDPSLKISIS